MLFHFLSLCSWPLWLAVVCTVVSSALQMDVLSSVSFLCHHFFLSEWLPHFRISAAVSLLFPSICHGRSLYV
ncbi:hypothetical protein BKA83DRAFT_4245951 [Pisolithus microcarpus]|nr:hypothetical protein BKA83DRAFT_4245951 [Pisolithus microcarpus]